MQYIYKCMHILQLVKDRQIVHRPPIRIFNYCYCFVSSLDQHCLASNLKIQFLDVNGIRRYNH